jgi:uncharacterized protein YndB with AHSA1/START domain
MSDVKVEIRKVLDAPRDRVWRAWTDPEELKRWWGPGAFTTPDASVDLRPGGRYVLVMLPPGANEPMRLAGTYREVVPPERLVYTWRWESGNPDTTESLVTVEFRDLGGRTEVTLTHDGFAEGAPLEMYSVGWEGGFEKLRGLLPG